MRTSYVELKIGTMRKSQRFIIYPVMAKDRDCFLIQSDKAIGRVNLDNSEIYLSKSRSSGSYGPDLCDTRGAKLLKLNNNETILIEEAFNKMAGITANSGISPDDRTITLLG